MAIAFRSATEAGTGSAAANLSVNVPSGVQDDDLLLLFGVTADGDDGGFDALTGWTEILDAATFLTGGSAPSPPGMSVWWRVASSEPASYTITPTFGSTGICAQMLAFTGVDTTTPIDVTSTTATGDGTNADPPSITTTTDTAITVVAAFWDSTTAVYSAVPSGYTSPGSLGAVTGTGGGNGCTMASAYRNSAISPAGAENPGAYTSNAEQWGAPTVALRPIVGPTITSIDTDDDVDDEQDPVLVAGSTFGASDTGSADVEIGDNAVYATANKISQTRNSWSATSISIVMDLGTQSPGTKWLWVTDSAGARSSAFPFAFHRAQAFRMAASSNITASGENTTRQLAIPATKIAGDFDAGRIQDDENPADSVDIGADGFTELEWCILAKDASREVQYDFRVTKAGTVIDTYTVTPQLTISAGAVLDATGGSYTWTGQTASLEYHSLVEANTGSYAWTGQTASLEFGSLISAESGSYSWAGQDVSFLFSPALIADAASYSWTGQDVSLELGALVAADAGSYAWTGQDASLEFGAAVVAEAGAYSWTGQDASLEYGSLVSAESGSYSWTGNAASLEFGGLVSAESASYAWTGQDVTFPTGLTLSAETASYAWTGQTADLVKDTIFSAEAASYVWTGQDADLILLTGFTLNAEAAAYNWSGQAATLNYSALAGTARRYGINRGKGVSYSKGVRDHLLDVGGNAVSINSEDVE